MSENTAVFAPTPSASVSSATVVNPGDFRSSVPRFTEEARTAVAGYLAGHQRGRLGNVETSYEMFGLTEDGLRARFAPYVERFLG